MCGVLWLLILIVLLAVFGSVLCFLFFVLLLLRFVVCFPLLCVRLFVLRLCLMFVDCLLHVFFCVGCCGLVCFFLFLVVDVNGLCVLITCLMMCLLLPFVNCICLLLF